MEFDGLVGELLELRDAAGFHQALVAHLAVVLGPINHVALLRRVL